jgi:hypothetical protein
MECTEAQLPNRGSQSADSNGLREYLSRHGFSRDAKTAPSAAAAGHSDWAVFVNLAANESVGNTALRMDEGLQEQRLIDMTRGKPIKIIVQTTLNDNSKLNGTGTNGLTPDDSPTDSDPKHTQVVRYEISNGTKRLLAAGPSQGMKNDLAALLGADPDAMKANHVMLINEAHGDNMFGFSGDSGQMFPEELQAAVAPALKAAGKTKFDVLDLVGCDTGDAQELAMLGRVGKFIVGSEEPEWARMGGNDTMQPVAPTLARLIEHTGEAPLAVARDFVNASLQACAENIKARTNDGAEMLCGVNTLSVYDGDAAARLPGALDQLGKSLLKTLPVGNNDSEIRKIIEKLPPIFTDVAGYMGPEKDLSAFQHRDLGAFVQALRDGLGNGSFADNAAGELTSALNSIGQVIDQTVRDNFNSPQLGNEDLLAALGRHGLPKQPLSGLSTVIPVAQAFNPEVGGALMAARQVMPIQNLQIQLNINVLNGHAKPSDFAALQSSIEQANVYLQKAIPVSPSGSPAPGAIGRFMDASFRYASWLKQAPCLTRQEQDTQLRTQITRFNKAAWDFLNDRDAWRISGVGVVDRAKKQLNEMDMPDSKSHYRKIAPVDDLGDWKKFAQAMMQ